MKTFQLVTLIALIGSIGLSSCSKKTDDVTPAQTQTQSSSGFKVKIDGKDYAPDFSYALAAFPGNDKYYAIYGLDSKTSDVVAIALPNTVGVGTTQLTDGSFVTMTIGQENFSTINAGSGTVTITKKTATNIVGTFSLTAYDPTATKKRVLTDGTFDVAIR